ncbi:uncharacterized protein EV422DRAFT_151848 [Fimicolochytrium jonesii]|uniref:uncharacterized protein n=1 Tax=Fimicolochytrium jonesii TaxID=1396493 RepID=UPI0022FDEAFD|nr:uncharacterized protein EV422DRAFT_151848 [Fimicolochytrium jonesii]KAI8826066.1 hypothetical protein EV422DRAFT_151848 [Fimicolochytrium jonesii]
MPPVLVSNFLQIAIDEQTAENDVFSLEWSFFIPPGAPAFVGPPGTPATQIEWDTRRISVLLRGYDKRTNETVLAPMRYNWATGVLGRWRAGSMQDDMTSVPEINSFMTQAMQYNYHNNDLGGLLSKLTLNSNVSIVKKSKLASLIRISAKQCRKEGVRYLQ